MDDEAPKPMKKVHKKNLFNKVGRKLEKLEQRIGLQAPNLSYRSESSSDISTNSRHRNSEYDEEQADAVSLQYLPHGDSPRAVLRHKQSNRQDGHQSSTLSIDSESSSQWHVNTVELDSSRQYDGEMKKICEELMDNNSAKLHTCREYDKKISLLRIAVSFNTPKVIVPVLLYLENTLSKSLFHELIKKHPSAIKSYINLAKLLLDKDSYIAMLKEFNKNEDVAMIRLRQAKEVNDIDNKIAILDQALIDISSHYWWHLQIIEQQQLLYRQRDLRRSLTSITSTTSTSSSSSQSNIRLENRTALDTYKILYDTEFRQQKQRRQSDRTIVERSKEMEAGLHMSPEMIMCGKLSVIMHCGLRTHYEDFVAQALHQGIFGKKYVIPPENLADMVYNWVRLSGEGQEKASEKAGRFLSLIQNTGRRIYYAEKYQNYDVAMDTIAHVLRDRVQLEQLYKRIPPDHPSSARITELLGTTKWRN